MAWFRNKNYISASTSRKFTVCWWYDSFIPRWIIVITTTIVYPKENTYDTRNNINDRRNRISTYSSFNTYLHSDIEKDEIWSEYSWRRSAISLEKSRDTYNGWTRVYCLDSYHNIRSGILFRNADYTNNCVSFSVCWFWGNWFFRRFYKSCS